MAPPRSGKSFEISVKSSLRTLQILEYIDSRQRAVTIAELSATLGFPQSSTSTLVQSMINAGYLVVDHDGRHILPSSRVAALGSWIEPRVSRADIRSLMVAVGEQTSQTLLLGVASDLCVRYIDVIPGRHAMRLDIPVGARLPLMEVRNGPSSAIGDDRRDGQGPLANRRNGASRRKEHRVFGRRKSQTSGTQIPLSRRCLRS